MKIPLFQHDAQRRLAKLVSEMEPTTRPELADRADLTRAAVGLHINHLIRQGLLSTSGAASSRGGRPATHLRLDRERNATIGVVAQDGHLCVAVCDFTDRLLHRSDRRLDSQIEPDRFLSLLMQMVRDAIGDAAVSHLKVRQIAASVAAGLDPDTGVVLRSSHFPKLRGLNLRHELEEAFGIPTETAFLTHVAYSGISGPQPERGPHDALLSWGMGVMWTQAYARDLQLFNVFDGTPTFNHVRVANPGRLCTCGRRGCMEAEIAMPAVIDRLVAQGGSYANLSIDDLVDLARLGDSGVRQTLEATAEFLGDKLGWIVQMNSPQTIWLMTYDDLCEPWIIDAIYRGLKPHLHEDQMKALSIRFIEQSDQVLMRGACRLARMFLFKPSLVRRLRVAVDKRYYSEDVASMPPVQMHASSSSDSAIAPVQSKE